MISVSARVCSGRLRSCNELSHAFHSRPLRSPLFVPPRSAALRGRHHHPYMPLTVPTSPSSQLMQNPLEHMAFILFSHGVNTLPMAVNLLLAVTLGT